MVQVLVFLILLAGLIFIAAYWRKARIRELAHERIERYTEVPDESQAPPLPLARPFLVRYRWAPYAAGLLTAALVYFVLGLALPFVVSISVIVTLLSGRLEAYLATARVAKIEAQLADVIDLMVAALQAGAGVSEALENAMVESHRPLRPQLEEVVGRIRYGENPRAVYRGLSKRVPLETFLLFSSTLSVQSETGGSLAPTLSSVGRTVRDRIEIARRIRSNSAQSEASTMAVLVLTYFIALIVWRGQPAQMEEFLSTTIGQWAVAGTMLLQAVGMVWMSMVSRMKF